MSAPTTPIQHLLETYNLPSDLLELPFDQFSRQFVAKVIVESRRDKPKLKILDLGGYKGKTAAFFPDDDVTVADIIDVTEPGYIKVGGTHLPFSDQNYDAVLSFDVLEHVAPNERPAFIAEAVRVSRDLFILAAPFETGSVGASERQLNQLYRQLNGTPHQWLQEHIDNGLPDIQEVETIFKDLHLPCQRLTSNRLDQWRWMQALIFFSVYVVTEGITERAFRDYNAHISPVLTPGSPAYRQIFCASRAKTFTIGELEALFKPLAQDLDPISKNQFVDELVTSAIADIVGQQQRELGTLRHEVTDLLTHQHTLNLSLNATTGQLNAAQRELAVIKGSKAWKLITHLRKFKGIFTR